MKKVSELTGAELDYWVAKVKGYEAVIEDGRCLTVHYNALTGWEKIMDFFYPSSSWGIGGQIIEREEIAVRPSVIPGAGWVACLDHGDFERAETPLIAAMRAYVASKYGDEVPSE